MEDGFRLSGYVGNAAAVKPINNIWKIGRAALG
jgi:hypothetical protein